MAYDNAMSASMCKYYLDGGWDKLLSDPLLNRVRVAPSRGIDVPVHMTSLFASKMKVEGVHPRSPHFPDVAVLLDEAMYHPHRRERLAFFLGGPDSKADHRIFVVAFLYGRPFRLCKGVSACKGLLLALRCEGSTVPLELE